VNLQRRLAALERSLRRAGCGLGCPPRAFQHFQQDGPGAEPVLVEGQTPPAPCPRCGRPSEVTPLVVCFDPDFYRNASLLHEPLTRPYSTAWRH
jgi:hypothetical protein